MMEVQPQPDWLLQQSEGPRDEVEQDGDEQRERMMVRRRKRVGQV